MRKFILFSITLAIVSLFPVSMQAQHPDNLPKERQTSNKQDNRRVRYQGDVAIEHILNLDDCILGFTGVTTTHGVRIDDMFFFGAGAGCFTWAPLTIIYFEYFDVSLFFSVKGYFPIGRRKKLCVSFDVGENLEPADIYIYPRVGISFLHGKHRQINISVGYQKTSPFSEFDDPGSIGLKVSYSW